jgi:hypothetical protein
MRGALPPFSPFHGVFLKSRSNSTFDSVSEVKLHWFGHVTVSEHCAAAFRLVYFSSYPL